MKKVAVILLRVFLGFLALLLLLAGISQTQVFRDRLRAFALSSLQSSLNAEVYLGELQGNLLAGFSLDSLSFAVDGIPVVATNHVELHYNLFSLPGREISFGAIVLTRPTVQLLRNGEGSWNFQRMVQGSEGSLTTGEAREESWVIDVRKLELRQGIVLLVDSTQRSADPEASEAVDYRNFTLRNVDLSLAAHLDREKKHVSVSHCSFDLAGPPFHLRTLTFELRTDTVQTEIKNLRVVTDRSDLDFDGELGRVNLLGGPSLQSLQHSPIEAKLAFAPLDCEELRRFLPALQFLDGKVTGEISVAGEFGKMEVKGLALKHGRTALLLKGEISNLHRPSELALDVQMENNEIDADDLQALLPGLALPAFPELGVAALSLQFRGKPLDFSTSLSVDSKAGSIRVPEFSLRIGGPRSLSYRGTVTFRDLNPALLAGNPALAGRLNGEATIQGEGVSLETLGGSMKVTLDSSTVRGEPVSNTSLSLSAQERHLLAQVQLTVGRASAEITGTLDELQGQRPAYSLRGAVRGINLGEILQNPAYESDITLALDAKGSGLTWRDADGTLVVDYSRSRFHGYALDSGYVQLTLTAVDTVRKTISFGSPVLDAVIDGAFHLPSLTSLLTFEVQNLRREIGLRLAPIDSTLRSPVDAEDLARSSAELVHRGGTTDAEFTIQLKNLEPLRAFLDGTHIVGTGFVTGELRGGYRSLSLSSDVQVEEFAYGNEEEGGLFIEGANVALDLRHLTPVAPMHSARLRCIGSVAHLAVNRAAFDSLSCHLEYADTAAVFSAGFAGSDRQFHLSGEGTARLNRDTVAVGFSKLSLAYRNLTWNADPGGRIELMASGLEFRDIVLRHEARAILLDGVVGRGGTLQASLRGTRLDLDDVNELLPQQSTDVRRPFFGGTAEATITAGGTLADPEYHGVLHARGVRVREMPVGSVSADLEYRRKVITGRLEAKEDSSGTVPQLRIEGSIPINLSLVGVEGTRVNDEPVDISVRADHFQIAVFDPFLPAFDELTGFLRSDLHVSGPLRDPRSEGSFTVSDGAFLFEPNNIRYDFDGTFRAAGKRLKVDPVHVRNLPEDERGHQRGELTITGDLSLQDLRPGDFNLNIAGSLLVVKESTRRSALEVSGELFAEIGPGGLRFTGEIEHSLLKGEIIIRNSVLVFPPSQAQVGEQSATSVPLVNLDDTTKIVPRVHKAAEQYFMAKGAQSEETRRESEAPTASFMDGLRYDLEIEPSGGSTSIEMIFNSLTSEKLVATINGRFSIRGDKSHWLGELTISQAYYNFLKRFEAQGKIRYTGDFLNPELDITATYQNTRTVQDSTGRKNEKVVVIFKITGTKNSPKIETNMTIDDVDYANYTGINKSNDVQSDALQFIVYGNFPLTATQRSEANPDLQKQLGVSAISGAASMLTGALSEFLRAQTGFINSVDFRYGGDQPAEIRLSGSALNGFWRFGGRFVEDPLANADFSLLYSFEAIFGNPALRNLMFEFERRVESSALQLNDLKRVDAARLFYRFSF